jgi:hypothetical protein
MYEEPKSVEPNTINHKPKLNWKSVLTTLGIAVLFATLAFGATYYYMNQQANNTKASTDKQIAALQKQITTLQKLPSTNSKTTTDTTSDTSKAIPASVTENGVTLTISKNSGPAGTVVQVSISGLPANTTPPFAGLNFLASNGGGTTGYDVNIDTRTLKNGTYQTDYTIPVQISLGSEPPATSTPVGLSYIKLNYTDPTAYKNQQPSDKILKVPFTVTNR